MIRARRSVGEGRRSASPAFSSSSTVTTIVVLSSPQRSARRICVCSPSSALISTHWARGVSPEVLQARGQLRLQRVRRRGEQERQIGGSLDGRHAVERSKMVRDGIIPSRTEMAKRECGI